MKINSIAYQRVVNLGNYESKRFEASAILDEDDDPKTSRIALIEYVEDTLFNLVADPFGEYHHREEGEIKQQQEEGEIKSDSWDCRDYTDF